MSDLVDVPASIYVRKTAVQNFETIHDILRHLSLAQSLSKRRNAPIWPAGTEGLKKNISIREYGVFSKDKSNKNDQYPGNLFFETSIKLFVTKNGP